VREITIRERAVRVIVWIEQIEVGMIEKIEVIIIETVPQDKTLLDGIKKKGRIGGVIGKLLLKISYYRFIFYAFFGWSVYRI
jgi:hypothetical protein